MATIIKFNNHNDFNPDYTPIQMFEMGIFKGCYFQKINNLVFTEYVHSQFIEDIIDSIKNNVAYKLIMIPNINHNFYKVECGSSYEQWCDKDWINHDLDPYGWVNWYINFYYGRRVPLEDKKQIKRWKQFKARHLGMLKSRGEKYKLSTNNLKTKQNLLHWAVNWN
jgi:hypothetical protein